MCQAWSKNMNQKFFKPVYLIICSDLYVWGSNFTGLSRRLGITAEAEVQLWDHSQIAAQSWHGIIP